MSISMPSTNCSIINSFWPKNYVPLQSSNPSCRLTEKIIASIENIINYTPVSSDTASSIGFALSLITACSSLFVAPPYDRIAKVFAVIVSAGSMTLLVTEIFFSAFKKISLEDCYNNTILSQDAYQKALKAPTFFISSNNQAKGFYFTLTFAEIIKQFSEENIDCTLNLVRAYIDDPYTQLPEAVDPKFNSILTLIGLVQYMINHPKALQDVEDSLKYMQFGANFDLMNPYLLNSNRYKQDTKHPYQTWSDVNNYEWELNQPQQKIIQGLVKIAKEFSTT